MVRNRASYTHTHSENTRCPKGTLDMGLGRVAHFWTAPRVFGHRTNYEQTKILYISLLAHQVNIFSYLGILTTNPHIAGTQPSVGRQNKYIHTPWSICKPANPAPGLILLGTKANSSQIWIRWRSGQYANEMFQRPTTVYCPHTKDDQVNDIGDETARTLISGGVLNLDICVFCVWRYSRVSALVNYLGICQKVG